MPEQQSLLLVQPNVKFVQQAPFWHSCQKGQQIGPEDVSQKVAGQQAPLTHLLWKGQQEPPQQTPESGHVSPSCPVSATQTKSLLHVSQTGQLAVVQQLAAALQTPPQQTPAVSPLPHFVVSVSAMQELDIASQWKHSSHAALRQTVPQARSLAQHFPLTQVLPEQQSAVSS